MVLGLTGSFSTKPESASTKLFFTRFKPCIFALFRMIKNNVVSEKGILIRISQPGETEKSWVEMELPIEKHEHAGIEYIQDEIVRDQGKIVIKRWMMPGFCMLYEELDAKAESGSEIHISGTHISMICSSNSIHENISGGISTPEYLAGIVNLQKAEELVIPALVSENNRITLIFSGPFLSGLLKTEDWAKRHILSDLIHTGSEKAYQYFLELPIRHILDSLMNKDFSPSEKRYYFELKLKELFFVLHLQPEISYEESPVPEEIKKKLIAAKAYLLANYHTAPTIKQLSRIISLNEFKLKQYFKMLFGVTIKSYTIKIRMDEARNLLWNHHSVNDVTARLGYKNVSHFILIFKRTFGVTPGQMVDRQG